MRLPWVRNTKGRPDAMLTFAVVSFGVVLAKFIISGASISVSGHDIHFGSVDAASIAALLTPTFGAYVARRHSDTKYGPDGIPGTADDPKVPSQREPRD